MLDDREQMKWLFDKMLDCVIFISLEGEIVYGNDAACSLYGYSKEEFTRLKIRDLDFYSGEAFIVQKMKDALRKNIEFDVTHTKKDGTRIPIKIRTSLYTLRNETLVVNVLHDMSAIYEEKYKNRVSDEAMDITNDAILIFDQDFMIRGWNKTAETLFGLQKGDVVGKNVGFLVPEDKKEEASEIMEKLRKGEKTGKWLTERLNNRGEVLQVVTSYVSILDSMGKVCSYVGVYSDVTEWMKNKVRLEDFQKKAVLALEGGSIGIWDYNIPMDRIEIYNHIGNKKYLIESSKSFIEQIAREDVRVLTESFRNISKTNDQFNIDIRLAKNGDASVRWFCMKGKAIEFDKQDKPVRIVGTMEDLSVRKDLEKEIMGKNKELKLMIDVANEACQAKSKFLANMSHEIRTPLNGIMLAVNGIKKESLSKNQTKLFSIIENSCTLLNGIVSEILDFSKIERGKVSVADEKVDMSGILQNAVNEIQMAANQKGLETSFYFDPRVQRQFWGDAQKTKQILNNLISNAVKFTYEGGIGLKAKLISEDETHVKILFEVKDSGIGIKTEMQDKVFEPFFQSEETSAKPSPGTGLGLLISKKYAEAMGGDLTFESQEKKGSIFRFQCSFRKEVIAGSILGEPEVMEQPVPKQEDRLEPIDKKRVLCVEDNMVNQELLVATLEEAGYYVDAAFSASEALNCMLENRPDIILMDIQLPLKSGYELAEEIKSMSEYREIPIIAVTAYARKEDRGKCLKAGMVDYVVKPIKIDELFEKIEKYIG